MFTIFKLININLITILHVTDEILELKAALIVY